MNKPKTLLIFILLLAALAACGQRGPLYLPDRDTPPAAVETPVEDQDEDEDEDEDGHGA